MVSPCHFFASSSSACRDDHDAHDDEKTHDDAHDGAHVHGDARDDASDDVRGHDDDQRGHKLHVHTHHEALGALVDSSDLVVGVGMACCCKDFPKPLAADDNDGP